MASPGLQSSSRVRVSPRDTPIICSIHGTKGSREARIESVAEVRRTCTVFFISMRGVAISFARLILRIVWVGKDSQKHLLHFLAASISLGMKRVFHGVADPCL